MAFDGSGVPWQPVEKLVDLRGSAGSGAGREDGAPIRVFDFGGDAEVAEARQGLQKAVQGVSERGAERRQAVLLSGGRQNRPVRGR